MIVTLYCEGFNGEATYTGGPKTNIDGTALQIANIGYAVAGSIVVVDIAFYVNGRLAARATTSFTPQLAGLVGIIGNDNPG